MTSIITRAVKYWFKAALRPGKVIAEFRKDPHKVAVSFWINFLFGLLYTITAFLFYFIHRLPAFPPWMPINPEKYYLYQVFWTIPWGLATWIMLSGVSHLLSIAGKKDDSQYTFEDALAVISIGWVVPSTFLMWIPETFIVPLFDVFWPPWVELLRIMVLPTIWQTLLVAAGLRKTHHVSWMKGIIIGLLTVILFVIMFMAFMR